MRRVAATFLTTLAFLGGMPEANATPRPEPDQCYLKTAPPTSAQWASRIPANAPALVLQHASMSGRSFDVEGSALRSKGREDVPLEIRSDDRLDGAILIVPKASLTERADYELSLDISCPSADPGFVATEAAASFRAWDIVALPTQSGMATAELAGDPNVHSYVSSLIHLTPSPELRAYLATTMFELSTDGKKLAIVSYGERYWAGASIDATVDLSVSPRADAWSQRTNVSPCAAADVGKIVTKSVSVQPHVAGAEHDPDPVILDVPLDCRPPRPAQEEPEGPNVRPESPPRAASADTSGCGLGGARSDRDQVLVAFGCVAAVCAVARRRRRDL